MAAVVDPTQGPLAPLTPPPPAGSPGITTSANRSIDAYLGAGDSMASIMRSTMMVGAVLIVLIAVAWALGVLPGAVKLF